MDEIGRGRAMADDDGTPMHTLDAIHLASALFLRQSFSDLEVLSSDERVSINAALPGFTPQHRR